MEIKKNLKALDVKISKMAADLGISRPTLDTYIDYYENGQQIPNEGYQKIFEYLFSSSDMNSIEFAQKYDYVKRVMLKDAKSGAERSMAEQREVKILNDLRLFIDSESASKPIIEFFNLFATNKDNDLVKAIYLYFNYTNGFEDILLNEVSDKDKALYSNLAKLFEEYKTDNIQLFEDYYQQVVDKNKAIFEKKKAKPTQDDIIDYIKNNINDSSNIDIDVLKEMINSMEGK